MKPFEKTEISENSVPSGSSESFATSESSESSRCSESSGIAALRVAARSLGFPLFGVVRAEKSEFYGVFTRWLSKGMQAEMTYMEDRAEAFRHPEGVLPGVKSVLALGMPFGELERIAEEQFSEKPVRKLLTTVRPDASLPQVLPSQADFGLVARYAASGIDYHDIIRKRLKSLQKTLKTLYPSQTSRGTVDTAPIFEREFAARAGLGFIGRNRMLIHPHFGSFFFLATVLTTEKLPETFELSLETCAKMRSACASCGRCAASCPAQALSEDGLDARRCLSALTIEHRGPIPEESRSAFGNRFFGCDVCQNVCPWNQRLAENQERTFLSLAPLFSMTEEEFSRIFTHTPFFRPSLSGLLRNARRGENE